jgi:pimeloyl-ACP methyl ester carboxylesterase
VAPRAAALAAVLLLGACSSGSGSSPPEGSDSPVSDSPSSATVERSLATAAPATGAPTARSNPTTALQPLPPILTRHACTSGYAASITCGTLLVPASRTHTSGSIQLPVAIHRATSPSRRPNAIVIPSGGPGFPGVDAINYWSEQPIGRDHDVITYDQRGTGTAAPSLECPEHDEAFIDTLLHADPPAAERQRIADAMQACRARVEGNGIDLGDYDSEASADDLDDLRQALGYDRWTIVGVSYGARLALASMRSHPEHLESVILDSVYDVTEGGLTQMFDSAARAIDELVTACADDAACNSAHPDLGGTIERLRLQLNDRPYEGDVDLGDGNGPRHFVITGDDAIAGLFDAMYDSSLIPVLPTVIDTIAGGDTSAIPALIHDGVRQATGQADLMALSVDCADNAGLDLSADAIAAASPGRMSTLATSSAVPLCTDWPVEPTSPTFNQPVVSDIPALVLAGRFDPITPPAGTEAVARRLPHSTFLLFPANGHGVTGTNDCVDAIEVAFLADPAAPLDTSCVADLPGPAFA